MFKTIEISLPDYKFEKVLIKELSIRQLSQVYKSQDQNEVDLLLTALSFALCDITGKRIITDDYTIDDFADELPQSYFARLADAYAQLNVSDEDKQLDLAKKS